MKIEKGEKGDNWKGKERREEERNRGKETIVFSVLILLRLSHKGKEAKRERVEEKNVEYEKCLSESRWCMV